LFWADNDEEDDKLDLGENAEDIPNGRSDRGGISIEGLLDDDENDDDE